MEDDIKPQRGMVIVAHPDDAEWGCSGTVAKWCRDGMDVVYIICTNGNKGTDVPEIDNQQLAEMRRQEQRDAADVLGVRDVIFLDYEDAMLTPSLELRKDISREIRRHRPDILISPCPIRSFDHGDYIGHPDHIAVGEATMSAVYPAAQAHVSRASGRGFRASQGCPTAGYGPERRCKHGHRRDRHYRNGYRGFETAQKPGQAGGRREVHADVAE